jgi:hypothetical protein
MSLQLIPNWLRVLGTAELPHIDQGVRQQFHAKVSLLNMFKPQQQPFEFILPRKGPIDPHHLPDVFLRDLQFNDERVLSLNPVHAHVVWVVHNRFRDVFDQFDDGRGVTSRGYTGFTASAVRSRRPRDDTIVRRFGRAAGATWHIFRWHTDVR